MKINEISSSLKIYLATVRVVLKGMSVTARTTINSDSTSNAFAILTRIYGAGNVLSLSQIVSESPRTCQIQQEAVLSAQSVQTQHPNSKVAQIQKSEVCACVAGKRPVSTKAVPTELKHRLVKGQLSKQLMRNSNIVKPSNDDIRIAHDRVATELKRADLEFQRDMDRMLRWQKRH